MKTMDEKFETLKNFLNELIRTNDFKYGCDGGWKQAFYQVLNLCRYIDEGKTDDVYIDYGMFRDKNTREKNPMIEYHEQMRKEANHHFRIVCVVGGLLVAAIVGIVFLITSII